MNLTAKQQEYLEKLRNLIVYGSKQLEKVVLVKTSIQELEKGCYF